MKKLKAFILSSLLFLGIMLSPTYNILADEIDANTKITTSISDYVISSEQSQQNADMVELCPEGRGDDF